MTKAPTLSLVSHVLHAPLVPIRCHSSRHLFWRLYLDWMATATDAETDALERALSPHAHHIRPLVDAIADALARPEPVVPVSLIAALTRGGWQPSVSPMALTAA